MTSNEERHRTLALSIGSSLAGMLAKFLTHPIDTVKAKLQVNRMQMRTLSEVKVGKAW